MKTQEQKTNAVDDVQNAEKRLSIEKGSEGVAEKLSAKAEVSTLIAGLLGLGIGLLVTYNYFSPLLPILAVLLTFFLALPSWLRYRKIPVLSSKPRIKVGAIPAGLFLIVFASCAYWEYWLWNRVPLDPNTIRRLIPANDPFPQNACSDSIPAGALLVNLGASSAFIPIESGSLKLNFPLTVLSTANIPVLVIQKSVDGLTITANVMNKDGQFAFRIEQNKVLNDTTHYQVRADNSYLAVYDERGEELFFVRYANASNVKVRGIFGYPQKHIVIISDAEIAIPALDQHITPMCLGSIAGSFRF